MPSRRPDLPATMTPRPMSAAKPTASDAHGGHALHEPNPLNLFRGRTQSMTRVFNFSPGPAMLPEEVVLRMREDLPDFRGTGMAVMELSHRAEPFLSVAREAEADLRRLLAVPDGYKVLFLQGGATGQFAGVPMNLLRGGDRADYVITGSWGKKALKEAGKYCKARVAARSPGEAFTSVPDRAGWQLDEQAAYVHYTPNETIEGVEFAQVPEVGKVPLVGDFSSTLLSRPLDVSRFGVIYAGAQKNIGPAGITIVIVRDDLVGQVLPQTPAFLDYALQADNESMYNTPPTLSWYVCGLVFKWALERGGLEAIGATNQRKAALLYDYIDGQDFYRNPVARADRSWMNVVFTLADAELDKPFLKGAAERGLMNLKGHRSVGGMRASLYNAMPEAGVVALLDYMKEFVARHG
jgi:phosphoserine aminotransferase apoenzyme (EC 2.6.1.52)